MATNLDLDPLLVDEALRVSGKRTKKEAVTEALVEYTARRQQIGLTELFGSLEGDDSYDYKSDRH
jgi:Arc/MetJ family transcription regulator